MRLTVVAAVAALFLLTLQRTQAESDNKEDWSWNGDEKATEPPKEEEGRSRGVFVTANPDDDSEEMVLEQVLEAGRSGRALHGFDDVYTDPQVQQALHSGNDSQARHYIKERLCNLGLMQCDFEPKRPYVQPHELIYAQPIHIKPVGEPIPAVPVKGPAKALHYPAGPGGHYGPPNHFGPPNHYGPPPRPSYIAPPRPALHPPVYKPSYKPIGGPVYGPPKPVRPPPVYEEQEFSPGHKVIASVPAVATAGVQQHVHHHFHHPTGADKPTVVVDNLHQSPGAGYDHHDHHSLGVNGVFSGPVNGLDVSGSYGPSYSGESSYGSSGFYKKEFNLKPSSSNTLGSDSYLASSSHQTGRQDGAGGQCYCVPYDQCLPHEIARKEDFGYAIDPRNNDKGIEAEIDSSEVVHITDANGTNVATERIPSANNEEKTETRRRREAPAEHKAEDSKKAPRETPSSSAAEASPSARQANYFGGGGQCGPRQVCCRRPQPLRAPPGAGHGQCGRRNAQGINGRIKNPSYVDGDSEFGEYPWQVAILKKDTQESVYVCGGTLIDALHIITAAHCVKTYNGPELRVRLGEWDVNHDVEFYPYVERDVARVTIHPEFYAGTLANDIAILRLAGSALDLSRAPHISPACLPSPGQDYTGSRCWTTGWGKDAFGEFGKYQNILKEVDIPVVSHHQCQSLLQQTRLGYEFKLHPGMLCAGGEEGKDACKGDGGGPMVCEKGGSWQVVGIVSWGIGCGQYGVPGVYVKVAHYADWIRAITSRF